MRLPRAFTLIELISVVAAITILAAIAVPNFLEAQVRSKTASAKAELAVAFEALEAYYADHLSYPPNLEPFPSLAGQTVQPISRIKAVLGSDVASPIPAPTPASGRLYPISVNPFAPGPVGGLPPGGSPFGPPPISAPPRGAASDSPTTANPFIQPVSGPRATPNPAAQPTTSSLATFPQPSPSAMEPLLGQVDPFNSSLSADSLFPATRPVTDGVSRPWLDRFGGEQAVLGTLGRWQRGMPPAGANLSVVLSLNGFALSALTTPVAYTGRLPIDPFSDIRGFPLGFFSYSPYDTSESWGLPAADGRSPHIFLFSWGPDTNPSILNPYNGPFELYDPTNGTVSEGELFSFSGVPIQ